MNELVESQVLQQLTDKLVHTYPEVEPGRVSKLVEQEYARYYGRPLRDYVPLFVERHAKEELDKLVV
jgi:hypothetical protein